jgi:diphosphomevalonate decarboxylase
VVLLLDRMRAAGGTSLKASVRSTNDFPTAAGLASSASGFAALVTACNGALGLGLDAERLSALARECSASASRSLFAGAVQLLAGAESAEPVASPDHFPLRLLVAVTQRGPKKVGSSEAMERTRRTSPYYAGWLDAAPELFTRIKRAYLDCDLEALGPAMEQSTLLMHASMLGATPAIRYFEPTTLAVLDRVDALQREGIAAYFTMDAGPHVKVLTEPENAERVRSALERVTGVVAVLDCGIGGPPRLLSSGDA